MRRTGAAALQHQFDRDEYRVDAVRGDGHEHPRHDFVAALVPEQGATQALCPGVGARSLPGAATRVTERGSERMEQRNEDGRHTWRPSENACNLNSRHASRALGRHSRPCGGPKNMHHSPILNRQLASIEGFYGRPGPRIVSETTESNRSEQIACHRGGAGRR
jgi:hypothetical protein